jgi:hypothetical protein
VNPLVAQQFRAEIATRLLVRRALRRLPVFEDFVRGQQALVVGFAAACFFAAGWVEGRSVGGGHVGVVVCGCVFPQILLGLLL